MGTNQGKIRASESGAGIEENTYYNLNIVPSKSVFTAATEDITGQVILDLRKPFTRPGLLVISLDGRESFEYVPQSLAGAAAKSGTGQLASSGSAGSGGGGVQHNESKFLREREVLA
jgi:hypothetical protein